MKKHLNTCFLLSIALIVMFTNLIYGNTSDVLLITKGTVGASDTDLYTISSSGTDEILVYNNSSDIRQARWSADNSKITFSSTASSTGKYEVFIVNNDGTNLKQITATNPTYGNGFSLFRSDSKIWYANAQNAGVTEVYEINWDGTGSRKLTNFESQYKHVFVL